MTGSCSIIYRHLEHFSTVESRSGGHGGGHGDGDGGILITDDYRVSGGDYDAAAAAAAVLTRVVPYQQTSSSRPTCNTQRYDSRIACDAFDKRSLEWRMNHTCSRIETLAVIAHADSAFDN